MAKRKPKTTAKLISEAATLLQKLRRMEDADDNGYCVCVTCNLVKHWAEMQGGHFIERGKSFSKLLPANINSQCPGCNLYGMKKASYVLRYRRWMVNVHGEDFVTELEDKARENAPVKRCKADMLEMVQSLKDQIKIQYDRLGEG